MKAVFGSLVLVSTLVFSLNTHAMVKASPRPTTLQADSNFSTIRDGLANQIVMSAASHPRYLPGTHQRESLLGSTNFRLVTLQQNQRITLIASLRQNDLKKEIPMGVSSNPKDFHLDLASTSGNAPISRNNILRLDFRGSHTTPSNVGTRTLTYDRPVTGQQSSGRLVAIVNQTADVEHGVWKTNGTYLYFQQN